MDKMEDTLQKSNKGGIHLSEQTNKMLTDRKRTGHRPSTHSENIKRQELPTHCLFTVSETYLRSAPRLLGKLTVLLQLRSKETTGK